MVDLFTISEFIGLQLPWSVVCEIGVTIVTIELWHVVSAVVLKYENFG